MIKYRCNVLICMLLLMLLTGCWDSVAIEERGFVVGSAVDKKDGASSEREGLTLTNQFVVPPGVRTGASGGDAGEDAFVNLSASGESMFAMDEDMARLTSKDPFFEHVKIFVVSEGVMNTPHLFANTLDIFMRNKEMRRGINVIVAEDAKAVLEIQPKNEKLPAIYIHNLLNKSLKETSLFKPVLVGDIQEYFLTNSSFTIPKLKPLEHEVQYEGDLVYHGHEDKVVGSLSEDEMIGFNLITSKKMHGGSIEFKVKDSTVTFQIYNVKRNVTIDAKDKNQLKIHIDIGVEGGIGEVFGNVGVNNAEMIDKIEKEAAKAIEELVRQTVERAQNELHAEIFNFDVRMRERHYDIWQEIKNDWDHGEDYFAKSDIQVTAKVKVRTAGAIDKTDTNKKEE